MKTKLVFEYQYCNRYKEVHKIIEDKYGRILGVYCIWDEYKKINLKQILN